MSEFTDAINGALGEAMAFAGTKTIALGGITVTGDLDQLGDESYELEEGGKLWRVTAHFLAPLAQFGIADAAPKAGKAAVIDGRNLTIVSRDVDEVSIRFRLGSPAEV